MATYLVILNEVERNTVLSALEKSTIYGANAKDFATLLDKVAGASPAEAGEKDGGDEQEEEVKE